MHAPAPFALTALSLLAALAPAQQRPLRPVLRPALPLRIDARTQRTDLLVVKFAEGLQVRLDDAGQLVAQHGRDLGNAAARLAGRKITPVFSRSVADLDAERDRLNRALTPTEPLLADLNNYFHVGTRDRADAEALASALLEAPEVETCYPEFAPTGIVPLRGDIPPTTPLFESGQDQGYFAAAAQGGHDYLWCRNLVGARGHRPGGVMTVVQLEGSWIFGHEDCSNLVQSNVIGLLPATYNNATWWEHGTACVGILSADRNGYGTRGFANAARLKVASLESGSANMVSLAMAQAQPGDVFTSSFAFIVGNNQHAPRDWPQADFDVVRACTTAGITYTFGAGNSGTDLADPVYLGRYTAPVQSGGLIIGASDCGNFTVAGFSNRGARIDCHSWGGCGTTLGYGDLFQAGGDNRQNYTSSFGGTSQAGPLVAGCAAVLSGVIQEQLGRVPSTSELRTLLTTHGTTVATIGTRPDLRAALAALGLPDGLQVTQEGARGSDLVLTASGAANRVFAVLVSNRRGQLPTPLNRAFLLGTTVLEVVGSGSFPAQGSQALTLHIPNDPALSDVNVYAQAVDFGPALDVHLSNSVEIWIP